MPLGSTNSRDPTDPLIVDHAATGEAASSSDVPGAQWSTPLIGRESMLNDLEAIVRAQRHRFVTITGTDGVGKTRLVASLLERAADMFSDGVIFIPLSSVTSDEIAVWSIAEALGVSGQRGEPIEAQILRRVQGERLLIVLNDLATIPNFRAFLEHLSVSANWPTIIVVNETLLGISGEYELRVTPLTIGDSRQPGDAANLLLNRASGNSESIIPRAVADDIARRSGGMPLALELIGAQFEHNEEAFTSGSILDDLSIHLPLPPVGEREAVFGAIAWTYDQLAAPLRVALRQLSVFIAGFSSDAASALLTGIPGGTLDGPAVLEGLVGRSILVRVLYEDGQVRYWMPSVIRTFTRQQFEDEGEARDACQRHSEWCLEFAEAAEQALKGPSQTRWRQWVARELSNIRVALEWLYSSGQASSALLIATALGRFWSGGAYMNEGRHWLERGLSGTIPVLDLARARALDTLSWLVLLQGDVQESREMVSEALTAFRRLGDVAGIATTLDSLGELDLADGDFRSAIAHLDEGLRHWRELGNRWSMAMSLITLGTATLNAGQRERSRESLMKAHTIMKDTGDERGQGLALLNLAWLYLHQDQIERATPVLNDALTRLRVHGAALEAAEVLEAVAAITLKRGDALTASRLYLTARASRRDAGIRPDFLSRLGHLAERREYRRQLDDESAAGAIASKPEWSRQEALAIAEELLSHERDEAPAPAQTPLVLTPRERDVLDLLADELAIVEIAERLGISLRMATTISDTLCAHLGVSGRSEVAAAARRLGLVQHAGD